MTPAMMGWTTEAHLENVMTGEKKLVVPPAFGLPEDIILALAQIGARFVYEGVHYISAKPTVDPIARKLIYWCEGYPA